MKLVDEVACTAATNVVNGSLVLHHLALALELLIEAEDGALLLAVDVAGTTTACGEVGTGRVARDLDARGRARGSLAVGEGGGINVAHIAGAAATAVDVVGLGDRGVGLSEVIGGAHFGSLVVCWFGWLLCCEG